MRTSWSHSLTCSRSAKQSGPPPNTFASSFWAYFEGGIATDRKGSWTSITCLTAWPAHFFSVQLGEGPN